MKALLIVPLLAMKLLSPSAGYYNQDSSLVNASCIADDRTYLHLNATIINNMLTVMSKDSRKRINKTNDNNRCGLKIIRNTNANNFKVKYGIFSNADCTGHSGYDIICAHPEGGFVYSCRRALKCCDSESNFCLNNFGLKRRVITKSNLWLV